MSVSFSTLLLQWRKHFFDTDCKCGEPKFIRISSNIRQINANRNQVTATLHALYPFSTHFMSLIFTMTLDYFLLTGIDKIATVELKRPKPEELVLNTEVLLKCQITGNPDLLFDWYHNTFRWDQEDTGKGRKLNLKELRKKQMIWINSPYILLTFLIQSNYVISN